MNMEAQDAAFDRVMQIVGDNGPFQKRFNIIFNVLLILFASMAYMNIILALNVPDHWCYVPGREYTNYTIEQWNLIMLPREKDNRGKETWSSCFMYNKDDNSDVFNTSVVLLNRNQTPCQHGVEFNKTWYDRTAVTDESWVCNKEMYVTNTFVLQRLGEVVGTFVFGQLGDTLGRRLIYYISLFTMIAGRVLSIFTSSNFIYFSIASIVGSLTSNSIFQSPLIIAMETSKKDDRAHIAMLQSLGWCVGLCLMPLVFWWTRDWIWFLMITTLPGIVFAFFPKYMIESPRWLANKGYLVQCVDELKKIAKINGKDPNLITVTRLQQMLPTTETEQVYGVMSLFSSWRLSKNTILIVICWIICSLAYFILVLYSSRMGGNPFLNFFWQSAVEMPAYIIGKSLGDRIGRRFTNVLSFAVSALTCIPLIMIINDIDHENIAIVLATVIKFFTTITFFAVNLQAMETYPTCLRQTGISIGSISANALGVLGPYIVYLGTNYDARFPYMILLVGFALGALAGLFLPETLHQKLPETLAEAQNFGAGHKFWSLPYEPASVCPNVNNEKEIASDEFELLNNNKTKTPFCGSER